MTGCSAAARPRTPTARSAPIRSPFPASATNYTINYVAGTLTVTPYTLTVTADNQSRAYGDANPTLTGSLVGLENGDNITASFSTAATATDSVGTYPITVTLSDPDGKLANYTVTTNNGTLTITAARSPSPPCRQQDL